LFQGVTQKHCLIIKLLGMVCVRSLDDFLIDLLLF
jgi:hypothetical protein